MKTIKRIANFLSDPYGRAALVNQLISIVLRRGMPSEAHSASNLPDFWEQAHAKKKTLWLTGSRPKEVIHRLAVANEVGNPEATILDVGVGLGYMAQHLFKNGKRSWALDISKSALDRVSPFVEGTFISPDELPEGKFSLVMHHLVAQHMNDSDLSHQIRQLIRSLSEDGLISMQFASLLNGADGPSDQTVALQAGGGAVRSPSQMENLVAASGGRVLEVSAREIFAHSQYWVIKFK
jgi:SAM-dependent methyltransferase